MNVIGIVLDTLRADIIGKGKKLSLVETPNMDNLMRESVTFTQAFGEAQPTIQMRRSFFTGRRCFPFRYNFDTRGVWPLFAGWHKIPPEQSTLAETLLDRGYLTGLIGDVYHIFKPTMNFTRGFVTYEFIRGQETDNWRGGSPSMIEKQMKKHAREPIDWSNSTLVQYLYNMRGRRKEEDYLCAQVFRQASQWLEDNHQNSPFLLWIEAFDPHEPWDPPPAYADKYYSYKGKDFIYPYAYGDGELTPEEIERIKALYYGEVTFLDKWIGYFLNKVNELNLEDDTIIMLLSDHGTQIMDHGKFGKGGSTPRAYVTQINWLIRHPQGPRGKEVDALVQSHDVMPTILSLLDIPQELDGENVWPLVSGKKKSIRDHVVIAWAGRSIGRACCRVSVRDKEWNYIVSPQGDNPQEELYRLSEDKEENNNLASKHPDVIKKQKSRIEKFLGQTLPVEFNELCDSTTSSMPCWVYQQKKRKPK